MSSTVGRIVVDVLTNKSGGAVAYGDVVVLDSANDNAFTTDTSGAYTGIVGVCIELAGIASNASGRIQTQGPVAQINCSGSVTRGHYLKTHTVAKQAADAGTSRVVGAFAKTKTTSATPAAILFGFPDAASSSASAGTPAVRYATAYGTGVASTFIATDAILVADYSICQGRLTLTTATPVTTSDVTAATTVYFTPFRGALIGTYNGTNWGISTFTEQSISLSGLTASKNYDIFIVDGTLALEALVWTNDTTRATALVKQDGILCKTGALTRRYLGTIRITSTIGQTEDSASHRFVANYYNKVARRLKAIDTTDTWTYATATWREARAQTTNQVDYVCAGDAVEDLAQAEVMAWQLSVSTAEGEVGIGVDSTSANSAELNTKAYGAAAAGNNSRMQMGARYRGYPGIGYHYLAWLEYAGSAATITFAGDDGAAAGVAQGGIIAEVMA